MARRLSDWLLTNPVLVSPGYPYDVALLYGAQWDNAVMDERLVENFEEFRRRYAFPRLVAGRAEDFFRDVERRFGSKLPVRRGDTGLYWEDGAASTAAELAHYRATQLAARALELLALWDGRTEAPDAEGAGRIRRRADERRQIWRDLLLFGEHTWGAAGSVAEPEGRQTVAQWEYKRRFLDGAAAALEQQLAAGLLRVGGERAGVRHRRRQERVVDRRRPRASGRGARAQRRDRPARLRPAGAPAGHRSTPRHRAQAGRIRGDHIRRDAVRRAALDRHRKPLHENRHARQGSTVRRLPVRIHQAHRGR